MTDSNQHQHQHHVDPYLYSYKGMTFNQLHAYITYMQDQLEKVEKERDELAARVKRADLLLIFIIERKAQWQVAAYTKALDAMRLALRDTPTVQALDEAISAVQELRRQAEGGE